MDLNLKFDSEEAAKAVLYTKVATEWDNTDPENPVETAWEYRPNFTNIDTIGVMYKGGEWDAEGNVVTPPTELAGWHVNVRLINDESDETLLPFVVTPVTPQRVWA